MADFLSSFPPPAPPRFLPATYGTLFPGRKPYTASRPPLFSKRPRPTRTRNSQLHATAEQLIKHCRRVHRTDAREQNNTLRSKKAVLTLMRGDRMSYSLNAFWLRLDHESARLAVRPLPRNLSLSERLDELVDGQLENS
ncbi:hypothetical protein AAFF_G00008430 [Aldrovandia affinis]|uniref:Uncharacterized protein n=1 Tax=Aldrovandia affinis TaxID=143900 RepID=A0AAD7T6B3_9TELE|nr:hypothetical protein AAFF_G00008430 [Aldrovandia affinis]